jgi:hypothetical protein
MQIEIPTNSNVFRHLRDGVAETPALTLPKATIYLPNEFFGNWVRVEVRNLVVYQAQYAQYPSALHVTYVPKGKRKARSRTFGAYPRLVVYEGWGAGPEPESMLGELRQEGSVTVRSSRRASCDAGWDVEMRRRVEAAEGRPVFSVFVS